MITKPRTHCLVQGTWNPTLLPDPSDGQASLAFGASLKPLLGFEPSPSPGLPAASPRSLSPAQQPTSQPFTRSADLRASKVSSSVARSLQALYLPLINLCVGGWVGWNGQEDSLLKPL